MQLFLAGEVIHIGTDMRAFAVDIQEKHCEIASRLGKRPGSTVFDVSAFQ